MTFSLIKAAYFYVPILAHFTCILTQKFHVSCADNVHVCVLNFNIIWTDCGRLIKNKNPAFQRDFYTILDLIVFDFGAGRVHRNNNIS